jgi:3-dehydroquinate dehydratase type I
MICVSLAEKTFKDCIKALKSVEFAEIRIDKMDVTAEEVNKLFSSHSKLIATCRPGFQRKDERLELLLTAVRAGAAYIDIEMESDEDFKNTITMEARKTGCQLIISYHNFEQTPDKKELNRIVQSCFNAGADLIKVACKVQNNIENVRLLSLLEDERPIIVIGLGEEGKKTRIIAPLLGSPFTYASLSQGRETAEGQLDWETLEHILNTLKNV